MRRPSIAIGTVAQRWQNIKCVDISGWNANDGARLIIWPCHGGANQKWYRR